MANLMPGEMGGMPAEYYPQMQDTSRQLKLADLLRQQSMQMPQGQMVSGHYVAPSITQYLAQALNGYTANKKEKDATDRQAAMYKDYQTKQQALADALTNGMQQQVDLSKSETPTENPDGSTSYGPTPMTQADPQAVMRYLAGGGNNQGLANVALSEANYNRGRADKLDDRTFQVNHENTVYDRNRAGQVEDRNAGFAHQEKMLQEQQEFQRIQTKAQQGFQLTMQEKQFAQQFQMQKQQEAFQAGEGNKNRAVTLATHNDTVSRPSPGFRAKPDGSWEAIPGGPADQKAQLKEAGAGTVNDVVGSLRDMYNKLDEAGGITSTGNRLGTNIAAGLSSSGMGQAAGRLFGTENQSMRNTIAQQRPLLLQAIMKATGMSAKQMDSNAELKLYLATATDPTLDVQANKRALDMIEKLYGSGAGNTPIAPSPKASSGVKRYNTSTGRIE